MRKKISLLIILIIFATLLGASRPPEPIDPPIVIPPTQEYTLSFPIVYKDQYPAQGLTSVYGTLFDSVTGDPYPERIVWLAEVWKIDDSLIWILDTARSPSTCSNFDGSFFIDDVSAWQYVFIVGNPGVGDYDVVQKILYISPNIHYDAGKVYAHTERASCRPELLGLGTIVSGELNIE